MALEVDKKKAAAFALVLIAGFEGYSNYPITPVPNDPLTVCRGHTPAENRYYSDAECDMLTNRDLAAKLDAITPDLPANIPPEILGAVGDFCFNVGINRCKNSTLFKYLKAGNYLAACNEFPKWEYAHGKRYNGLVRRRQAERDLCMEGIK